MKSLALKSDFSTSSTVISASSSANTTSSPTFNASRISVAESCVLEVREVHQIGARSASRRSCRAVARVELERVGSRRRRSGCRCRSSFQEVASLAAEQLYRCRRPPQGNRCRRRRPAPRDRRHRRSRRCPGLPPTCRGRRRPSMSSLPRSAEDEVVPVAGSMMSIAAVAARRSRPRRRGRRSSSSPPKPRIRSSRLVPVTVAAAGPVDDCHAFRPFLLTSAGNRRRAAFRAAVPGTGGCSRRRPMPGPGVGSAAEQATMLHHRPRHKFHLRRRPRDLIACGFAARTSDFRGEAGQGSPMAISLYDVTIPVFRRGLGTLGDAAQQGPGLRRQAEGIDPAELLGARLAPDMLSLTGQVQRASDTAKFAAVRIGECRTSASPTRRRASRTSPTASPAPAPSSTTFPAPRSTAARDAVISATIGGRR